MTNLNTLQHMTTLPSHAEQEKTLDYVKTIKRVCAYVVLAVLGTLAIKFINSGVEISIQESNLVIFISALTLLLAIPIVSLNIYFVSKHRTSSTAAKYPSQWSHWIKNELMAWMRLFITIAILALLGRGITQLLAYIN